MSVDWVIESEDYNEWMCEEDYEVESNGEPKVNLTPYQICQLKKKEYKNHTILAIQIRNADQLTLLFSSFFVWLLSSNDIY